MTLLSTLAAWLSGPGRAAAGTPAPFAFHAADASLIRRVLEETHVARSPTRPSYTSWIGALLEAAVGWIARFFSAQPGLASGIVGAAKLIALAVVLLAAALLVLSIARRVRGLRARRGPSVPDLGWAEAAESAPSLDHLSWRRRLEERLAGGDIAGALEALWWWIAISLAPDSRIDASWTTRELLERAHRPELVRLGSSLDVLMYGRRTASPGDVQECLSRFEERLP